MSDVEAKLVNAPSSNKILTSTPLKFPLQLKGPKYGRWKADDTTGTVAGGALLPVVSSLGLSGSPWRDDPSPRSGGRTLCSYSSAALQA